MKLLTITFTVLMTALAVVACVFTDVPSLPGQIVTSQQAADQNANSELVQLPQGGSLRRLLKPITVKPEVSPAPVKSVPKASPKPEPPLTFPMKLIGIVLSDSRSQAVIQARDQSLHTLSEGDVLPGPHSAMQVETIEADAVTFRKGQQTVRVKVKSNLP